MTDKHEHLDEGTIHAWLDGALPPDESAKVEVLAGACTECAALVAEARGLVAASSRILSSLDTIPGGVIPGVDGGVDQLAALRARRHASTRRWWNDRRVLVAASLVFVAGISSVVWRFAGPNTVMSPAEQTADAVQPFADTVRAIVTTPSAPAPPSATTKASEATGRTEAKAEAPRPLNDLAPTRIAAAKVLAESTTDLKKVAEASTVLPRSAGLVANEARKSDSSVVAKSRVQALDSMSRTRVADRATFELPLQQGAASQRQALAQARSDSVRPAAPPPAFGAGLRLGQVVTTGVGAARDAAEPTTRCYQLRLAVPPTRGETSERRRAIIVADSVQLLNVTLPELSDPTWYRAKAVGFADSVLFWRPVDSTTVELRSQSPLASRQLVVRFRTTPTGLPLPDLGREQGVQAALATRILCP